MAQIQTATGPVDADRLGFTLSHEHLLVGSAGVLQGFPFLFDMRATSTQIIKELREARAGGVETIIDLTTLDLGRDVELAALVSRESDVRVVVATGLWLDVPRVFWGRDPDFLARLFIREIEQGIGETGIKAGVITVAVVTPGTTADEYLLEELLWRHRQRVGRLPRDAVADRRYGTLHHYRYLTELGIRAVIGHRAGKKRNAGGVWNIRDFQYNAEPDTYTCPAGETLTRRFVRRSERLVIYRAPPGVCRTCSFRSQCSPSGKERGLARSLDRGFLEEAQRWLETEEGKRRSRQRKVYVETVFAIAKDRHGMRRAQWRGKWKVQIQVWLTAAAMNIKKLARATAVAGGASAGALQAFSRQLVCLVSRPRNRLRGILVSAVHALRQALGNRPPSWAAVSEQLPDRTHQAS